MFINLFLIERVYYLNYTFVGTNLKSNTNIGFYLVNSIDYYYKINKFKISVIKKKCYLFLFNHILTIFIKDRQMKAVINLAINQLLLFNKLKIMK